MEDLQGMADQYKKDTDNFLDNICKNYANGLREVTEQQIALSHKEQQLQIRESQCSQLASELKGKMAYIEQSNLDIERLRRELGEKEKELSLALENAKNQEQQFIHKQTNIEKRLSEAVEKELQNNEKEKFLLSKESSLIAFKSELASKESELKSLGAKETIL